MKLIQNEIYHQFPFENFSFKIAKIKGKSRLFNKLTYVLSKRKLVLIIVLIFGNPSRVRAEVEINPFNYWCKGYIGLTL